MLRQAINRPVSFQSLYPLMRRGCKRQAPADSILPNDLFIFFTPAAG